MRDLGLTRVSEPFANLLTQGMVLNHIFFRKGEKGGITYYPPADVEMSRDDQGRVTKVTAVSYTHLDVYKRQHRGWPQAVLKRLWHYKMDRPL